MGQAQRSDRRNVPRERVEERRSEYATERRRKSGSTGNRTGSARRNGISLISGGSPLGGEQRSKSSRTGGAQRSRSSGERAGRCSMDDDGLESLELWEISREDDNPRMMRLADREQVRSGERHSRSKQRPVREDEDDSCSLRRGQAAPRAVSSIKRRRAKRRRLNLYRLSVFFVIGVCLILIYQTTGAVYRMVHHDKTDSGRGIVEIVSEKIEQSRITPPEMIVDYLEPNEFSRPGTELKKIKSVFVHYTANPGTSAAQNRSYFANLAETQERSASAHFIIGYEGELIQCIPLEEQAYAVATRNEDSVSIECCYLDEDGKFTQETYDTLVHTLAWLTQEYHLSEDDILRHYDCGGKMCPLYYVEHEDAWEKLLADVESYKEN